jgi:two-component system, response regulator YesN
MKLLIMDDEPLARMGLRTIIPWAEKGFTIIGEASNVNEALEIARKQTPDLILVDIIMPEKDGFELIQEIQRLNLHCQFVIVSCNSSIEYYKRAISFGVVEYIQKSTIEPEELLRIVEKVTKKICREKMYEELLSENAWRSIPYRMFDEIFGKSIRDDFADWDEMRQKLTDNQLTSDPDSLFIILFQKHEVPDIDETGDFDSETTIAQLCGEIIKESGSGFIFKNRDDILGAFFSPIGKGNAVESVYQTSERIQETLRQLFDAKVSIGISAYHPNLAEVGAAMKEAETALERSFFDPSGNIFLFTKETPQEERVLAEIEREREMLFDLKSFKDSASLHTHINKITKALLQTYSVSEKHAKNIYLGILYHIIELFRVEKIPVEKLWGEDLNPAGIIASADSLAALHREVLRQVDRMGQYCSARDIDKHSYAVEVIKKYITANLYNKLSLTDIAHHVAFSPNYICRLFKRETGETVFSYIQRQKVEEAKMLLNKNLKVGEVSEQLHFSNESYFAKIFKRYTGMTSTEFTRQY